MIPLWCQFCRVKMQTVSVLLTGHLSGLFEPHGCPLIDGVSEENDLFINISNLLERSMIVTSECSVAVGILRSHSHGKLVFRANT